jgi:hypothetical protein
MAWKVRPWEEARLVVERERRARMGVEVCIVAADIDVQRVIRRWKM